MLSGSYSKFQSIARQKTTSTLQKTALFILNRLYFLRAISDCTALCRALHLQTYFEISNLMNRWSYLLCSRAMPYLIRRSLFGNLPQQKYTCEPFSNWSLLPQTITKSSNLSLAHFPPKYSALGSILGSCFCFCFPPHIFFCLMPQLYRLEPIL